LLFSILKVQAKIEYPKKTIIFSKDVMGWFGMIFEALKKSPF
jgi:hypothetical protein